MRVQVVATVLVAVQEAAVHAAAIQMIKMNQRKNGLPDDLREIKIDYEIPSVQFNLFLAVLRVWMP